MKKVFAIVMALSMIFALAVTSSATVPSGDFTVTRTSTTPTIDGKFDSAEGWGSPIISVTGQEMYDYATSSGDKEYIPWAVMEMQYFNRTDGSVEALQAVDFKVYAKWDDAKLYLCYVVSGLTPFYPNAMGVWYGNSIQFTVGQDNRQANWTDKANDPDKDGVYDGGYVGNEYTIAIAAGKTKANVTQGTFGTSSASMRGAEIVAKDLSSGSTGLQVYEMALPFDKMGIAPEANKSVPFATALNINISPDVIDRDEAEGIAYPFYNGIQVGKGIFDQAKADIWDSMNLVLTGTMGSVGGAEDSNGGNTDNNGGNTDNNGGNTNTDNNGGNTNTDNNGGNKDNTDSADSLDAVFCGLAAVAALGALVVIKKK